MIKLDMFDNVSEHQVQAVRDSIALTNQGLADTKYKVNMENGILYVYSRNAPISEKAIFAATFSKTPSGDLCFTTDCGHDDVPWCEHLEVLFKRRMDRPLIAMLVGRRCNLIVPVYPRHDFGLVVEVHGEAALNDINVSITLWRGNKKDTYEVGTIDHSGSVKSIKNMLEDLVYHVIETTELSEKQCDTCYNSVAAPEMPVQDVWHIMVNGVCSKCSSTALEDVVPEVDGRIGTSLNDNSMTVNKIADSAIDLQKIAQGSFEGNTHGK